MIPAQLDNGILEPEPRLTPRQLEGLVFLWRYYEEHRQYPTQKEMSVGMGAPVSTVVALIEPLVKKGVAAKPTGHRARNLRLTALGLRVLQSAGIVGGQLELNGGAVVR